MDWDKDAMDATKEIPFFLRKMIRGRIESAVTEKGKNRVTLEDVRELRSKAQDRMGMGHGRRPEGTPEPELAQPPIHAVTDDNHEILQSHQQAMADPLQSPSVGIPSAGTAASPLTEDRFKALEKLINSDFTFDSRCYHVKGCGGSAGCPLTLVNPTPITNMIVDEINRNDLPGFLQNTIKGPVLSHHKFKASVAGCANCCSEPQIKDLGLIAQMMPRASDDKCIECMQCVDICKDAAVTVTDALPHFDRELCMSCGECIRVCPTGSIEVEKEGYAVLVGGKLGRHAQLAVKITELADEETVRSYLRAMISLMKHEAKKGERLGAVAQRLGSDQFTELLRKYHDS